MFASPFPLRGVCFPAHMVSERATLVRLKHDSMVVQLDEFQGALRRWDRDDPSGPSGGGHGCQGVTADGLCDAAQRDSAFADPGPR